MIRLARTRRSDAAIAEATANRAAARAAHQASLAADTTEVS